MWKAILARLRGKAVPGEIRFSPESLASLAELSPGLVGVAVDERIVLANPAAERLLGASRRGELIGHSVFDFVHPEDRPEGRVLLARVRDTGEALARTAVRMIDLAGAPFEQAISATAVEYGGRPAILLVGRDLDEVRAAREALQESEQRYQTLAAVAPVALYRLDPEGRCLNLNQRWSELTGIPTEEALGQSWLELVSDEGAALAHEVWRRVVAGPGEYRAEHQIRQRGGRMLQVLSQVAPERDASGRVVGWVGTLTDLSDLKEAQLALADSEDRLRVALEAANMATWEADIETGRVEWSRNAGDVLGRPQRDIPTNTREVWSLIRPEEVSFHAGDGRAAIERGKPFEIELRIARDGAEPRWVLARGQVREGGPGRGARMVGVVADVTAGRRLAEERELLEQKLHEAKRLESLGLLAGGVAHDFNNLLVGILGNAELALARLAADAPARALVDEIRAAGSRAAELANQILSYSGHGPLISAPVDLAEVARDTLTLLRPSLRPSARLGLEAPPEPQFVAGDATQLRQILMNLVTNACESLAEDGGDVRVRFERLPVSAPGEAAGAEWIALEVADTGSGMDPPTCARIFDPFFTTRATGRGLGLAVVHGIVRAHGGRIDVESAPGRGTRMRLLLPATRAPLEVNAEPRPALDAAGPGSALVLVVDDERAVREVARLALEAASHRVLLAANGAEAGALVRVHGRAIDAIVLDLTLGPVSSESVLAEIRARAADLPVLVTSGYPEEEAIARLAALGVSGFVQKPFTPAQLVAEVTRILPAIRKDDAA